MTAMAADSVAAEEAAHLVVEVKAIPLDALASVTAKDQVADALASVTAKDLVVLADVLAAGSQAWRWRTLPSPRLPLCCHDYLT